MKKGIHPEYRQIVFKDLSSDFMMLTGSTIKTEKTIKYKGETYPLVEMEVSSGSHPFFTGTEKILDTGGRVEQFKKKMELAKKKQEEARKKADKQSNKKSVKEVFEKKPEIKETEEVKKEEKKVEEVKKEEVAIKEPKTEENKLDDKEEGEETEKKAETKTEDK